MAEIETRVAVLERDISQMSGFFDRLDSTMEKLTDISSSIKELLAVHELKLNQHDDVNTELYSILENRRIQTESQHQLIQAKIIESEKETNKRMDDFQKSILDEMKEIRKDLKNYHDEATKTKGIIDKYIWVIGAMSALISFILVKIGVIPFMPPH